MAEDKTASKKEGSALEVPGRRKWKHSSSHSQHMERALANKKHQGTICPRMEMMWPKALLHNSSFCLWVHLVKMKFKCWFAWLPNSCICWLYPIATSILFYFYFCGTLGIELRPCLYWVSTLWWATSLALLTTSCKESKARNLWDTPWRLPLLKAAT